MVVLGVAMLGLVLLVLSILRITDVMLCVGSTIGIEVGMLSLVPLLWDLPGAPAPRATYVRTSCVMLLLIECVTVIVCLQEVFVRDALLSMSIVLVSGCAFSVAGAGMLILIGRASCHRAI
jgi:hypothetical protein